MEHIETNPAATVIERLGGQDAVARIAEVDRTRVYRWTRPKSEGGTGGIVPMRHIPKLISFAEQNHIELAASDFIPREPTE